MEAWGANYWLSILVFHLNYLFSASVASTEWPSRILFYLVCSITWLLRVGSFRVATAGSRIVRGAALIRWSLILSTLPVHLNLLKNHQMWVWNDFILLFTLATLNNWCLRFIQFLNIKSFLVIRRNLVHLMNTWGAAILLEIQWSRWIYSSRTF